MAKVPVRDGSRPGIFRSPVAIAGQERRPMAPTNLVPPALFRAAPAWLRLPVLRAGVHWRHARRKATIAAARAAAAAIPLTPAAGPRH
jgi:hypothetical protein